MNLTGNTWGATGLSSDNGSTIIITCAGRKALSVTLDRLRFTTTTGTDVFDGGSINISYE